MHNQWLTEMPAADVKDHEGHQHWHRPFAIQALTIELAAAAGAAPAGGAGVLAGCGTHLLASDREGQQRKQTTPCSIGGHIQGLTGMHAASGAAQQWGLTLVGALVCMVWG